MNNKKHAALMVQGTTSDAGKSTLVAGLCRVFIRKGIHVAPFKPQNMALNSAVTIDGGEIGRAQAVQAKACKLPPHTDMNPILLKPTSDKSAQVIIHGKAIAQLNAKDYHAYKKTALNAVLSSYQRLGDTYETIVIEGAGSPAEINLRENDVANMGFAEAVDCPVIIIADIDRGGVFAHIVGTLMLLSESEQARVKGFVINRFRGDIALLQNGLDWLEEKTQKPVLGVLPYIHGLHLEAEDAIPKSAINHSSNIKPQDQLKIIVPVIPHISNHTDFDPLRLNPDVHFEFIGPGQQIPAADLIILPGSKSVISDLMWLKNEGWADAIYRHVRFGGKVIGVCGGYQMLGSQIFDPLKLEGNKTHCQGLNLLNIETKLKANKQLENIEGNLSFDSAPIKGYEIHAGDTTGEGLNRPVLSIDKRNDGAISDDDQVLGTYIHGLFDQTEACCSFLRWAGLKHINKMDYEQLQEDEINRLADVIENHLDINRILAIAQTNKRSES